MNTQHEKKVSEFTGCVQCSYWWKQNHPQFPGLNALNFLQWHFKKLLFKHWYAYKTPIKEKKQHVYIANNKTNITTSLKRKWLLAALVNTVIHFVSLLVLCLHHQQREAMPMAQALSPHFNHAFFTEALSGISSLWQNDMQKKKKKVGTEGGTSQSSCHAHVYNGKRIGNQGYPGNLFQCFTNI